MKQDRPKKTKILFVAILIILLFSLGWIIHHGEMLEEDILSPYPNGRNFAFTITDDPDGNRLEDVKIVYDFLTAIGLRTTKALWVEEPTRSTGIPDLPTPRNNGDSCESKQYLLYMYELKRRGFELALHTVSSGNDPRETTLRGYETFKSWFGEYPKINIMHSTNLENIYWGKKVLSHPLLGRLAALLTKRANFPYAGEEPGSKYFWGDILKEKTEYVRLWGTSDINTLKFNPSMPYHDQDKPYVNYWFSFSDGKTPFQFNNLLSDKNVTKLIDERGASIVYTHFGRGFVNKGVLDETFQKRLEKLSRQKDGWFVPASKLLDRLLLMKKVIAKDSDGVLVVSNFNNCDVEGVTLLVHPGRVFYALSGTRLVANEEGEIILRPLKQGEAGVLLTKDRSHFVRNQSPTSFEYLRMVMHRLFVFFSHNF